MLDLTINIERLKNNLLELAKIGYNEADCGIYRQGFSDADIEARHWLIGKLKEIDIDGYMDGAANVIGKTHNNHSKVIGVGSHLDSVPCAGMFDGALGVMAALEVLNVIHENKITTKYPIEIFAFSDEEGRFGGMFGVEAICGLLNHSGIESAEDAEGVKLKNLMQSQGMDPKEALNCYREPSSFHAFLELHVEQGPVLEKIGKSIGIVEGIAGVFKWLIHFKGKADHEGTAPMDMRSDTFMGLADFAHEIPRIIDEEGTDKSRLTVGKAELKPGYPHTVPGEVVFSLVGRDLKVEVMEQLASSCRKVLSSIARKHNLMFEYQQMSWLEPKLCHDDIISTISTKAKELNLDYHKMMSGAGHDTQFMTDMTRAGMIFVPSIGGVSHAPDEWTHWSDIEKGCDLLLQSVLDLSNS